MFHVPEVELQSTLNPELRIDSRRDVLHEQIELSNFVWFLDQAGLSYCLEEIFYDSGGCLCVYSFKPLPLPYDLCIKKQVDELAGITISQYEDSFGLVRHGAPMEDEEDSQKSQTEK